jgi:hypothetical protein
MGVIGPGKGKLSRTRRRTNMKVVFAGSDGIQNTGKKSPKCPFRDKRHAFRKKNFEFVFSALFLKKGSLLSFCVLRRNALLLFLFIVLE